MHGSLGGYRLTHAPPSSPRPRQRIKLVFQEEGQCLLEQGGHSVLLNAGQWCAYDKAQPHSLSQRGYSKQSALVLPAESLRGNRHERWHEHLLRPYSALTGPDRILHSSLVAAIGQIDALCPVSRRFIGQTLLDLVELTLVAKRRDANGGALQPARSVKMLEVLAYVDAHLSDPTLDIDSIAQAFGCSKRYLHKLFADYDTTLSRLIWNRRLDRCYADLGAATHRNMTITDVAFSWGFKDSHHFSRLFKDRFGMTPSEFRRGREVR
ncbi:MAG: AraC family transcriptional regulator [Proteobacteria bacterium]|nr:MAG: AraC family transcriptional regulator [Pseudomonadota bacterium]